MTTKEKTTTSHKILTVIGSILCVILIPILAINITLIVKSYTNQDEVPSIGGVFPLIVLTDSMQPEIDGGDLIICHTIDAGDVKDGDIIAFFDPAGNGTSIVTHRVTDVIKDGDSVSFRTKGDANNAEDRMLVEEDDLVGVYQSRIPGAGNIAMFMQSTTGLIICVVLPIVLLIGYDFIRRKSYEKKQHADTDALLAELEALRAEKARKEEEN
ncbi:MAG: signal peptidase I [Firmicutes bacterium]|nr:signal peptidase I [Bacillota bacterium]